MQVPLSIADELIGSYGKRASKQVQVGHVPLRDRRLQVLARLLRDEIVKREAHLRPKGRDDDEVGASAEPTVPSGPPACKVHPSQPRDECRLCWFIE